MDRLVRLGASPKAVLVFVLVASLGALGAAYAAQYGFGLEPCVLCLYQRVPYAATGGIALLALVAASNLRLLIGAVAASGALFVAGAAIAFYHVGVEQHWWASVAACGGELPPPMTVEELRARLATRPPIPCDRVAWSLFGVSMAGYNALFSMVLAVGAFAGARAAWQARTA